MKHPDHIDLQAVFEEPVGFVFELPLTLAALDREPLVEISPVRLEGTVSRVEGGFRLESDCRFEGKLECSRCLAPYPFGVDEAFTLLLYPRRPAAPGVRELSRDDLDVSYYTGDAVDVGPIAEERVQMAIPMKPLCREDCRGICARCGADRNAAPCGCSGVAGDPRWNALAGFPNASRSEKA
jgi:uncharacterized protein